MSEDSNNTPEVQKSLPEKPKDGHPHTDEAEFEQQVEKLGKVTTELVQVVEGFQGPLPPPSMLQHYQQIQPDLVERIISLTEREASHRHDMDRRQHNSLDKEVFRGQMVGATVALTSLAVAAFALWLGHATTAGIIGGTTVVGLASVFVVGRLKGENNSSESQ